MSNQLGSLNNIASLWDRSTGKVGAYQNPLGTPTPDGAIVANYAQGINLNGNTTIFEEASDSPQVEVAEQWTITHRFYVDYYTGVSLQSQYFRGYRMTDSLGNVSRVLSTTLVPIQKTNVHVCLFTIVSEGTNFGQPPDECSYNIVELNPVAEKHPRYSNLTYQDRYTIRQAEIGDFFTSQQMQNIANTFSSSTGEKQQALELLYKKFKGEDTFYLSAFQLQYSQYYWIPQIINPGGYIEDPIASGNIPAPFYQDQDGNNIFQNVATYNQNLYPTPQPLTFPPYGLSWLRYTDTQVLNRTWWKVTRTWVGAPIGNWDLQWYSPQWQAYQTSSLQGAVYTLPAANL